MVSNFDKRKQFEESVAAYCTVISLLYFWSKKRGEYNQTPMAQRPALLWITNVCLNPSVNVGNIVKVSLACITQSHQIKNSLWVFKKEPNVKLGSKGIFEKYHLYLLFIGTVTKECAQIPNKGSQIPFNQQKGYYEF